MTTESIKVIGLLFFSSALIFSTLSFAHNTTTIVYNLDNIAPLKIYYQTCKATLNDLICSTVKSHKIKPKDKYTKKTKSRMGTGVNILKASMAASTSKYANTCRVSFMPGFPPTIVEVFLQKLPGTSKILCTTKWRVIN